MTSSGGGGGDGGGMMALMRGGGTPMPGLPIAGSSDANIDPYTYGQFQNFLPDIKAEGQNDMATGLRPDMFNYQKPGGGAVDAAGGGGGNVDGQIQELRDQLAKLQAGGGASQGPDYSGFMGGGGGGDPMAGMLNGGRNIMGGGGGGFGPAANGVAPPADAQQLPTPPGGWARGNVPGWPMGQPQPAQPGFADDWRTKDTAPLITRPGG